jgi:hypothetical protein
LFYNHLQNFPKFSEIIFSFVNSNKFLEIFRNMDNRGDTYLRLQKQFLKAIDHLDHIYRPRRHLVATIKNYFPTADISESGISKHVKYQNNEKFITYKTYRNLIEIIDPFLLKVHSLRWDQQKEEYEDINLFQTDSPHQVLKNISAFEGFWICYSSNKFYSMDTGVEHFNIATINIQPNGFVECRTKRDDLNGELKFDVNTNEIIHLNVKKGIRKVHFVAIIGNWNPAQIDEIPFAYLDTGHMQIRCGLAIMKRSKDYSIEIGVFPVSDLKGKIDGFIDYLLGKTQLIADPGMLKIKEKGAERSKSSSAIRAIFSNKFKKKY